MTDKFIGIGEIKTTVCKNVFVRRKTAIHVIFETWETQWPCR